MGPIEKLAHELMKRELDKPKVNWEGSQALSQSH
jgi:hypothetical protein